MGMKSCCVPDRASVQAENIRGGAFPRCALRTASLLSMEERMQAGIPKQDGVPGSRQRIYWLQK